MGNLCGGCRKLAPAGPPEATAEGSLSSPQVWEKPRHKDPRRSGSSLAFLPSFVARRESTHTSGANINSGEESMDVDGTTLIVPPSTNLAQLQSMVDIAEEGTTLDLKGATIQMDGVELAGGCLLVSRGIRLYNGALLLPPRCSVDVAHRGCELTLSEVNIRFDSLGVSVPAIVVRKGAHLRLEDCCIEGGSAGDAVQILGVGSSMRARSCQISSSSGGAAVSALAGGHATMIDCSMQGLVGLEAANAGSKICARQCTMDGSTGSVEGTGVAISDGATGDLEGCTMYITACGLEVHGKGTRLHAVNTVANSNKEFNVSVAGGAAAHLVDCTINSAGTYGLYVADRGTAHLVGCFLSHSGMHNVVVSGGAAAFLQKCRTFGIRAPGYAAYGNNSRLEVADCSWSPQPPPKMLQGASRHYRPSLPEWLR